MTPQPGEGCSFGSREERKDRVGSTLQPQGHSGLGACMSHIRGLQRWGELERESPRKAQT